ncbi:D-alanyl-D-alanine carboxypeptidase [Alkalispirochaeta americana]|uniref:D-alanyl-D-alanine carboxypeptidase n=1 Tax=Alkalispirochaeta americana TaxID=159291 RepID=A0A1N6WY40_9SPIO|nr:M15 family metallopeptidase [Alkalispirochaeta americana]SIQ95029.1 D-alanyl-D-alanine carboxypeptidase [Alkalispirochaeta americana]
MSMKIWTVFFFLLVPSLASFASGEVVMKALARAYPDRIESVEYRRGEWALSMDGEWFSWAQGRLLPEAKRDRWQEFVPIRFYRYEPGPFTPRKITPEVEERLRQRMVSFDNDGEVRFNAFLDRLYGIASQQEAERAMVWLTFLDRPVQLHPLLQDPLGRVDQRLRLVMLADGETRAFVRDLAQVHGFSWRPIAGTPRRSYHSYGVALDLMPRSFRGRHAYWRWAVNSGVEEWWNLAPHQRWTVPREVIKAFEAEGFVWGGKWLYFDAIHFEYRPEILLMAQPEETTKE